MPSPQQLPWRTLWRHRLGRHGRRCPWLRMANHASAGQLRSPSRGVRPRSDMSYRQEAAASVSQLQTLFARPCSTVELRPSRRPRAEVQCASKWLDVAHSHLAIAMPIARHHPASGLGPIRTCTLSASSVIMLLSCEGPSDTGSPVKRLLVEIIASTCNATIHGTPLPAVLREAETIPSDMAWLQNVHDVHSDSHGSCPGTFMISIAASTSMSVSAAHG
jgi:hypothetical protein